MGYGRLAVLSQKAHPASGGEENPAAAKQFLKTVGSNVVLTNRTLSCTYTSPFSLVAQTDPQKNWLSLADDLRAYFERPALNKSTTR